MPESKLIPSIDKRLGAFLEVSRRQENLPGEPPRKPAITISREFGCEAYPMAELLRQQLETRTKQPWMLMDKALLDEVAKNHNLAEQVLHTLGEKNRFLDEFLSTFSSRWKSDKDYYRLLCKQIIALAEEGNVIIVGRGGAQVTQRMKNCYHFRMFASQAFKVASIAKRLSIDKGEAEPLVEKRQKERDRFIRDFLDRDPYDLNVYHLIFNNDRSSASKIADTIADYLLKV
ncbi:MAG: cytidylate kinase-like family protein [Trichlorobacter sp.]|jgi:cytidylate kinase